MIIIGIVQVVNGRVMMMNNTVDYDKYKEVINGENTYRTVAKVLLDTGKCIIGWTDQGYDHRDILFTYQPKQYGTLQRGLRWCYLYVSIMGYCSMGFLIEDAMDNKKHHSYIKEKLMLHDNSCDDKICELINGVIHQIDISEGYINEEVK